MRSVWLIAVVLLAMGLSGCLGGTSVTPGTTERAVVQNLMADYYDSLGGEEYSDLVYFWDWWDETEEDAFLTSLESALEYYADPITIAFKAELIGRENDFAEVGGSDFGFSEYISREFAQERLIGFDPAEHGDLYAFFENTLYDGLDDELFDVFLMLHLNGVTEEDLGDFLSEITLPDHYENLEVSDLEEGTPLTEVSGQRATHVRTYDIDWSYDVHPDYYEPVDGDSTMYGEASYMIKFVLEKASDWKITELHVSVALEEDVMRVINPM